jgi:hypothetical protein
MTTTRKTLGALALAAAVITAASPSFAQRSEEQLSPARAQALRECNAQVKPYRQYTWGATELDMFRACMAQHGQQE